METATFLRHLGVDGELLAAAVAAADWDAPVPATDWSLREVVGHVGAVHRWSADIVRRRLRANETGGCAAFLRDLPDDEIPAWSAAGHAALVAALTDAPDDLQAWTFVPGAPARWFWARRQAHETAIHRADVEAAVGHDVTPFDADFAQDGLAELLGGFARERQFATSIPGRLGWLAADGDDWLVTFGGERIVAVRTADAGAAHPDATVTGSSSDLYRWAWNRPSPAVVAGDTAVADLWRGVRIT